MSFQEPHTLQHKVNQRKCQSKKKEPRLPGITVKLFWESSFWCVSLTDQKYTHRENKLCLFHDESRYFDAENDQVVLYVKDMLFWISILNLCTNIWKVQTWHVNLNDIDRYHDKQLVSETHRSLSLSFRPCVGILAAPPEDQSWFCVKCAGKKKDKKTKKRKRKAHWPTFLFSFFFFRLRAHLFSP